jgi:hypothetical protein
MQWTHLMHAALFDDAETARLVLELEAARVPGTVGKVIAARNRFGFSAMLWAEWHGATAFKQMVEQYLGVAALQLDATDREGLARLKQARGAKDSDRYIENNSLLQQGAFKRRRERLMDALKDAPENATALRQALTEALSTMGAGDKDIDTAQAMKLESETPDEASTAYNTRDAIARPCLLRAKDQVKLRGDTVFHVRTKRTLKRTDKGVQEAESEVTVELHDVEEEVGKEVKIPLGNNAYACVLNPPAVEIDLETKPDDTLEESLRRIGRQEGTDPWTKKKHPFPASGLYKADMEGFILSCKMMTMDIIASGKAPSGLDAADIFALHLYTRAELFCFINAAYRDGKDPEEMERWRVAVWYAAALASLLLTPHRLHMCASHLAF